MFGYQLIINQNMKQFYIIFYAANHQQLCLMRKKKQSERLDSIFTVLYQQNQFNGTALIAEKGKELSLKRAMELPMRTPKRPINEKTIFELASCSKQFTATAIVLLKKRRQIAIYRQDFEIFAASLAFGRMSLSMIY
jgi:hypothetical protein